MIVFVIEMFEGLRCEEIPPGPGLAYLFGERSCSCVDSDVGGEAVEL